jgi:hypothetical protein
LLPRDSSFRRRLKSTRTGPGFASPIGHAMTKAQSRSRLSACDERVPSYPPTTRHRLPNRADELLSCHPLHYMLDGGREGPFRHFRPTALPKYNRPSIARSRYRAKATERPGAEPQRRVPFVVVGA